jgi:hypothetical protein
MAADRVWDEAERLVAAAIAAVSMATGGGLGARSATGGSFATGSPECCVCPVCRVIAAMRDPQADLADRLTTGVSDLATGVASLLRNLAGANNDARREPEPDDEGDEFWESLRRRAADAAKARAHPGASTVVTGAAGERDRSTEDDPWRLATTAPQEDLDTPPPAPQPTAPKPMAKKTARKAVRPAPAEPPPPASPPPAASPPPPASPAERPVVAKKAAAKKAVAKKAVAKKAVAKKASPREEPT